MLPSTLTRIRPARWFRHALSARDLASILATRSNALAAARDPRAGFCRLRARQAEISRDMIEAGAFGAGTAWVERLEIARAHRYLRALEGWDRGDVALLPAPWRAVFSLERQERIDVGLSLRLSDMVHEGYDLPLALARLGDGDEHAGETLAAYAMLGEVYAATADTTQRRALGPAGGPRRRIAAGAARQSSDVRQRWGGAWLDAQELLDAGDEARRQAVFARIETAALCGIRTALRATLAGLRG